MTNRSWDGRDLVGAPQNTGFSWESVGRALELGAPDTDPEVRSHMRASPGPSDALIASTSTSGRPGAAKRPGLVGAGADLDDELGTPPQKMSRRRISGRHRSGWPTRGSARGALHPRGGIVDSRDHHHGRPSWRPPRITPEVSRLRSRAARARAFGPPQLALQARRSGSAWSAGGR